MKPNQPLKIFFCQHPAGIIFFKNLAMIIRDKDRHCHIILVLSAHPYFNNFSVKPYIQSFDEVIYIDYVSYRKNMVAGLWAACLLRRRISQLIKSWRLAYPRADLFLMDSAWLPANLFLYDFARFNRDAYIVRFFVSVPAGPERTSYVRNLLISWYRLWCGGYKVKTVISKEGKFLDLHYCQQIPGERVIIAGPGSNRSLPGYKGMPYPAPRYTARQEKDMVILFGDATLFDFYKEYLPPISEYQAKLKLLFSSLEKYYAGKKLYYKPHPGDGGRIMPGLEYDRYASFDKDMNAETVIDKYQERILAVYSFASTSSLSASFYHLPAYAYYRYLCNAAGISKFDQVIGSEHLQSAYLYHLSDISDIGKIDFTGGMEDGVKEPGQAEISKILNIP